jgi:hypothetical protein
MATRLTEGTDLNHVNNPVQIKLYYSFLTGTLTSIFKIPAVLLYLANTTIIKAFTTQYKIHT